MGTNVIGVDMGGTKILSAVIDAEGNILGTAKVSTKAGRGAVAVIDRISNCIRQAVENQALPPSQFRRLVLVLLDRLILRQAL